MASLLMEMNLIKYKACTAFNDYMLQSERASVIAQGSYDKILEASYKLLPGDYIAYEEEPILKAIR